MKVAVVLFVCCALIAGAQAQNRPNVFVVLFNALFRRGSNRPNSQAQAAASAAAASQQASSQVDLTNLLSQQQIEQQQQQQQAALQAQVERVTVTETSTVFSPDLERITSIETVMEMMTSTFYETVEITETLTDRTTLVHSTTITSTLCPPSVPASIAPSGVSSE